MLDRLYHCILPLLLGLLVGTSPASAVDWQWSAEVKSVISTENNAHPRAFLWIPPGCQRVRAVIVGQNNMLEQGILEHPTLRKTLAELNMAAVWVTPAFDPHFRFEQGAGEAFEEMMSALAEESGYVELKHAPVAPIGHSAMASYPYHFGAWNPGRTLVAISIKGIFPQHRYKESPPWKDDDLDGVPILFINGEYEDAEGRGEKAAQFRHRLPNSPLTMFADVGGGHFDSHDRIIEFLSLYLRKVTLHRLPAESPGEGPVTLNSIDTKASGWLYERWKSSGPPSVVPAPVGSYAGDRSQAFWAFDEELARAAFEHAERERGRAPQLVGFVQEGQLLPFDPKLHARVRIRPDPHGDGATFKVTPTFLTTVPDGSYLKKVDAGSVIPHANSAHLLDVSLIIGPARQIAPDTWAVRFDRLGTENIKRSNNFWLLATHPGDEQFKRAVQQAIVNFPRVNTSGADQSITFDPIPNQTLSSIAPIKLSARSSIPAQKVHFYVREGPAEVDEEGNLTFTPIPPRARFPVKVTVVAWQWGRSIEPRIKSADPVTQTFLIQP